MRKLIITPKESPKIIRNCSKCGEKSEYINTEKFRVNANGNSIDIWLIYQCDKCKNTYNLTIYERIKPSDINQGLYNKFLSNDKKLALKYSFNIDVLKKNKAEINLDNVPIDIIDEVVETSSIDQAYSVIEINNIYDIRIRLDKLLALMLNESRSKIKNLIDEGLILSDTNKNINKSFARNKMILTVKKY